MKPGSIFPRTYASILACATAALLAGPVLGDESDAPDEKRVADDNRVADELAIEAWVEDLDASRFQTRELATEQLLSAGAPAISPLADALSGGSLEVQTRGVSILGRMALSGEEPANNLSFAALERLAEQRSPSVRPARRVIEAIRRARHRDAIDELEQLGAVSGWYGSQFVFPPSQPMQSLTITKERWKGKVEDLRHLKWLQDVPRISLQGDQVTDDWLKYVGQMSDVTTIEIKRAKISGEAIGHLKSLNELRYMDIYYAPVDNKSVDHFAVHRQMSRLALFGTDVTKEGADRLRVKLSTTTIDYRNGAFLGIGGEAHQFGFLVTSVRPGTAASRAGMKTHDIIAKYDGVKVVDFPHLTQLIGARRPGEKSHVEILRGGTSLKLEIQLGEWE